VVPCGAMARKKNPAAVALGRLGGKKGGKARMAALTPEQRSALGKLAAEAKKRRKLGGKKPKLPPAARRKLSALAAETGWTPADQATFVLKFWRKRNPR
jgi:hypothetical protein